MIMFFFLFTLDSKENSATWGEIYSFTPFEGQNS